MEKEKVIVGVGGCLIVLYLILIIFSMFHRTNCGEGRVAVRLYDGGYLCMKAE